MLTTTEAARHLGVSASWLNKSRMTSTGPVYLKLGGTVRYQQSDLDAWLSAQRRTAIYDHANDNQRAMRAAA
jgi:predicted DNA-binding transcriptional regulator AlpA